MRSFRIGAFLVLTVLVGTVAAVAYNLGVSAGLSDAAVTAGATVIAAPATISPLGIIVGGFFLLLFLGFLAKVIASPRRGMAHGGWGPGAYRHWDGENVPEHFRPMLDRWHQQSHTSGSPPSSSGPAPTGSAPGAPPPPPGWQPPSGPYPPTDQRPTGA